MRLSAIKRLVFDAYLATGGIVGVQVDASRCILPNFQPSARVLLLEYGLNVPVPIPDLVSDVAGITGTLSFGRKGFHTAIPWEAVALVGLRESGQWLQLVVFQDFLGEDDGSFKPASVTHQPPTTSDPAVKNDGAENVDNVVPFRPRRKDP